MSVKNQYLADPRAIRQAAAQALRPPRRLICPECRHEIDRILITEEVSRVYNLQTGEYEKEHRSPARRQLYCGHCMSEFSEPSKAPTPV